jgi:hypothetical protein
MHVGEGTGMLCQRHGLLVGRQRVGVTPHVERLPEVNVSQMHHELLLLAVQVTRQMACGMSGRALPGAR